MNKVETFLYTFIDEQTGEFEDILAPNESAARLRLGGEWISAERCPMLAPPTAVGDWNPIAREAQADAEKAQAAMMAAHPGAETTPLVLAAFNAASADHDRKRARVIS